MGVQPCAIGVCKWSPTKTTQGIYDDNHDVEKSTKSKDAAMAIGPKCWLNNFLRGSTIKSSPHTSRFLRSLQRSRLFSVLSTVNFHVFKMIIHIGALI